MKRIAIDMDEVIADAENRFFEWYEKDYGIKISPKNCMAGIFLKL